MDPKELSTPVTHIEVAELTSIVAELPTTNKVYLNTLRRMAFELNRLRSAVDTISTACTNVRPKEQ